MSNKKCKNCLNSFYGYGESSLNFGLRCNEYEKSIDEDETCDRWEMSLSDKLIKLREENEKLKNVLASSINWIEISIKEESNLSECRNDEDCDHCYGLSLVHDGKELLKDKENE